MPLSLSSHAGRGVGGAILLIAATTLNDLKEEPIIECGGVDMREFARIISVIAC